MSDGLWTRGDEWVGTEVDGSFVMVNVESGKYVALNETAHAIWNALETPQHAAAIAGHLRDRFDVPAEDCEAAVHAALETMQAMALVTPA